MYRVSTASLVMCLLACGGGKRLASDSTPPSADEERAEAEDVEVKVLVVAAARSRLVEPLGQPVEGVVTFLLLDPPTPVGASLVVRARRSDKKDDLTVKWRGGQGAHPSDVPGLDCERDSWLDRDGARACDVQYDIDPCPTEPASVKEALSDGQRALIDHFGGPGFVDKASFYACPAVATKVWKAKRKELPADFLVGCTKSVAFESWDFPDGTLHELSCKTTTPIAARAAIAALVPEVDRANPQVGKTDRALRGCAR